MPYLKVWIQQLEFPGRDSWILYIHVWRRNQCQNSKGLKLGGLLPLACHNSEWVSYFEANISRHLYISQSRFCRNRTCKSLCGQAFSSNNLLTRVWNTSIRAAKNPRFSAVSWGVVVKWWPLSNVPYWMKKYLHIFVRQWTDCKMLRWPVRGAKSRSDWSLRCGTSALLLPCEEDFYLLLTPALSFEPQGVQSAPGGRHPPFIRGSNISENLVYHLRRAALSWNKQWEVKWTACLQALNSQTFVFKRAQLIINDYGFRYFSDDVPWGANTAYDFQSSKRRHIHGCTAQKKERSNPNYK